MNKEISLSDISNFQKEYTKNLGNNQIEEKIKEQGITKACLNEDLIKNVEYRFNIEIPEMKIYNQKNSSQCNIYAFFRMIKSIIQKENPSIDINKLELSASYLEFFDKLEKINTLYNELLAEKEVTLEMINNKVNRYIGIYGTFHFCRELISKYGLVPNSAMKEVNEHYNAFETLELLKAKIKTDATILLNKNNMDIQKTKENLMKEAYVFLSKVIGNPPIDFDYENEHLTPMAFKEKYLKNSLEDYITVTTYDKKTLFQSYAFIPNVYLNNNETIKTVSTEKLKQAVIKQLQEGIAIWFSAEESTALDYDINILDDQIYRYNALLNIHEISKEEKLVLDITNYDHAMCITGALIEDGIIKQFKVDNSFGKHGQYKGHLIMTNSFFENAIITMIIHKKFLND